MTRQTPEETRKANESISRPKDESQAARHGKVIAGQRAEFAANPVTEEGSDRTETEKAAERASHNDDRP
jgi:hypothetical protein